MADVYLDSPLSIYRLQQYAVEEEGRCASENDGVTGPSRGPFIGPPLVTGLMETATILQRTAVLYRVSIVELKTWLFIICKFRVSGDPRIRRFQEEGRRASENDGVTGPSRGPFIGPSLVTGLMETATILQLNAVLHRVSIVELKTLFISWKFRISGDPRIRPFQRASGWLLRLIWKIQRQ
ncbi:unnamed protein product, partial [Cyprideis torosa]